MAEVSGTPQVVRCPKCGTDRWRGTGPCGTCGAFLDAPERTTSTTPEAAYRALGHCAERIGQNNWERGIGVTGKGSKRRYQPTPAHRAVVDAMLDVMRGRISVNDAYALLWRSDVEAERFPNAPDRLVGR